LFLLILKHLLKLLFLGSFGFFLYDRLLNFVTNNHCAFRLLFFVEDHVIVGAFISFNVDFERIERVTYWRFNAFVEYANSLMLIEHLYTWLSYLRVVSESVGLESPCHVFEVVVCSLNRSFRQLLRTVNKCRVRASYEDAAFGEDLFILDVFREVFLNTLFIIILIIDYLTVFVVLDRFLQEAVLRVFESAWVAIKDITAVTA